jgi:hypothetical protein
VATGVGLPVGNPRGWSVEVGVSVRAMPIKGHPVHLTHLHN